jgi:hypothetical protein
VFQRFPLTRAAHLEIQAEVHRRRAAALPQAIGAERERGALGG